MEGQAGLRLGDSGECAPPRPEVRISCASGGADRRRNAVGSILGSEYAPNRKHHIYRRANAKINELHSRSANLRGFVRTQRAADRASCAMGSLSETADNICQPVRVSVDMPPAPGLLGAKDK
jgi:hypothetical protein